MPVAKNYTLMMKLEFLRFVIVVVVLIIGFHFELWEENPRSIEKLASFLMSQITTQLVLIFDETENFRNKNWHDLTEIR